jgi:hypothetical protein
MTGAAAGVAGLTGGVIFGLDRRDDARSSQLRRLVWSVPTTLPLAALTSSTQADRPHRQQRACAAGFLAQAAEK